MTDKELKKLSRLELLELLLTESRENERLREELEKIKLENTIEKSAQKLNETSETLDEITEKLGTALKQVSSIISSLNSITGITVEDEKDSFSDGVDVGDKMNVIQEKQIISETTEPEVTIKDKSGSSDDKVVENHGQSDFSKRLDATLELISSKIKELDRLAGVENASEDGLAIYDDDEN